jgi:exodeoxyribonuclease V gamma subunit
MSLHLVESPHQEQLAAALVERMHLPEGAEGHLEPTTVIVQNAGLGRWLRLWHARECGISAGVKMPFAQSFIAQELEHMGLFERWNALSPDVLRWQIFDLLMGRTFEAWPDAGPLREYLSSEHSHVERRTWSLAARLADLYDRYAVHRPEWISAWLQGRSLSGELPHLEWQAHLFQEMLQAMGWQQDDLERRLLGLALQRYFTSGTKPSSAEAPLHIFGISSFPPAFLRFFQHLAQSREITLYHLIPSEAYLGELPKNFRENLLAELEHGESLGQGADLLDNALLIANGQAASRFQALLLNLDFETGEMPQPSDVTPSTDLLQLQNAVRMNEPNCEFYADGSLSIHRCHSRIREVQVLQQQLLAQFAADPSLRPEDVMVLVPEIADYTDSINSVFGMGTRMQVDAPAVKIPFCIADQKSSGDENCWRFFGALLQLLKGRQLFSEVAALLDFDPVCQRLNLDRDILKDLLSTMQAVGVRWGIDAAGRRTQGLPDYAAYTWDYGLQRLYDGLILGDDCAHEDRAPYMADSRILEAVGSLTQFLRPIFELAGRSHERATFREWSDALIGVLRQALGSESYDGGEWMRLLAVAIGELQVASRDVEIGFDTFCLMLEEGDHTETGPSGLLRRGVTFCRLQPARHIPARVVCILGLDEGSYPRQEKFLEFDLIQLQCRHAKALRGTDLAYRELHYLGDSHLRDEDRQLFLDCLLNARERLYLSYVGQSDLSNEELPPSLLVSELRQFLAHVPEADPEAVEVRQNALQRVIVRHPLQEWSLENFRWPQPQLGEVPVPLHFNPQFAAMRRGTQAVRPFFEHTEALLSEPEPPALLSADQLLRFLKDPAKEYLSQQLHVKLDALKWMETHEDQESLALDGGESWMLRQRVFDTWLTAKQQGRMTVDFAAKLKRAWQLDLTLPIGHVGESVWSDVVEPVINLLAANLGDATLHKKQYNYAIEGVHYQDSYWENGDGQRILCLGGGLKTAKYLLEAFIHHIGAEQGSVVLDLKDQTCASWPAFPVLEDGVDLGHLWLAQTLPLWRRGHTTALCFSLEIANEYVSLRRKAEADGDWEAALDHAHDKYWESYSGYGQDRTEAQCLCFDGISPASSEASLKQRTEFAANAEAILGPVLEWSEQVDPKKGGK